MPYQKPSKSSVSHGFVASRRTSPLTSLDGGSDDDCYIPDEDVESEPDDLVSLSQPSALKAMIEHEVFFPSS